MKPVFFPASLPDKLMTTIVVIFVTFFGFSVCAQSAFIDFNNLTFGETIDTQFSGLGVTFTNARVDNIFGSLGARRDAAFPDLLVHISGGFTDASFSFNSSASGQAVGVLDTNQDLIVFLPILNQHNNVITDFGTGYYLTFGGNVGDHTIDNLSVSTVPEPSTYLLFAVGILGILGMGLRQRKKAVKVEVRKPTPAFLTSTRNLMSPKKNIKSYHQLKAIGERQRTVLTQTMQIRPKKRSIRSCFAARGMDILLSCLGLGLGAIPMLAIAAAIKVNSKGPVLYRQKRVGKDGKLFSILKFRTMCHDAERETGPVWAKANDPRQTSLGTFLRQTKLDELPQLLNILLGEMTFVGPRPERPEFVSQFIRYMPPFSLRHQVKPGLTGLAQLRNGYDNSAASVYRKLRWDVEYIRRKCVRFDMWLISLTGKLLFQNMRFELATRMKLKCSPKKNGCIVSKNPILERR